VPRAGWGLAHPAQRRRGTGRAVLAKLFYAFEIHSVTAQ
jgi:hypothetical protein